MRVPIRDGLVLVRSSSRNNNGSIGMIGVLDVLLHVGSAGGKVVVGFAHHVD